MSFAILAAIYSMQAALARRICTQLAGQTLFARQSQTPRPSKLAGGKKIRFRNINDKLADHDGKLFDGMMNPDKLHPALKG